MTKLTPARWICKFAKCDYGRRAVGFCGLGNIAEEAEIVHTAVNAYLSLPSTSRAVPTDALDAGGIATPHARIALILRPSRRPQVLPSIVGPVSVDVIYLVRASAGHDHKGKSMRFVAISINLDHPITMRIQGAGSKPDFGGAPSEDSPAEIASLGVVTQKLGQARLRRQLADSAISGHNLVSHRRSYHAVDQRPGRRSRVAGLRYYRVFAAAQQVCPAKQTEIS